jgi:membrane protease YdiL (CAAX protease family)
MSTSREQPRDNPEADRLAAAPETRGAVIHTPVESPQGEQLSLFSPDSSQADSVESLPIADEPQTQEPPVQWMPPAPPEKDPAWSLEDLGALILFAFFSFIAANVGGVFLLSFMRRRFGFSMTPEQALGWAPWVVAMQTVWELLWLGFIYLTITKKYHRRFWQSLKWMRPRQSPVAFLLAGAGVAVAAQGIMNLFPSQKHLPIEKLFANAQAGYLLAFFGVLVAPFIEELVFRGFFYPVFERLWGLSVAVLLTALFFIAIEYRSVRSRL